MPIYDAFISYSHAQDKPIAASLQSVVQRLGKRWYRRRDLRVFRDDTSLSATPQLWGSIEQALAQSRFLILLASPQAAASHWVGKEVNYWLEHKTLDTLLIGVTNGTLTWDEAIGDFVRREDSPLPAVLTGRFSTEPKWVDLSAYRGGAAPRDVKFMDLGADFAATIRGIPKEDLLSQEVRQQRRALALAWSAASSLLVLAGIAAWQWNDAVEQRKIAEAQRDRAERTLAAATRTADTLIFDLAQEFRKRTGMPIDLIRLVLERVQDLQQQLAQAGERPPDLLRLEAVALDELYSTYMAMGDTKAALDAAERSRAILERLVKAFPSEVRLQRDLAVAINNVGDAQYAATGQWEESFVIYRHAAAIMERITTSLLPNEPKYQNDLAVCLNKAADMLFVGARHDEALATFRRSLGILEKLSHADPDNRQWQAGLAFTHGRIALVLVGLGQTAAALDAYRESVRLREQLVANEPDNTGWQHDLHSSLSRMGGVLATLGQREQALEALVRALEIIKKLAASDPANVQWQRDLATAHYLIGPVLVALGRAAEAIREYREGLAVVERYATAHPSATAYQIELISGLVQLGLLGDEQRARFERALAILRKLEADGKLAAQYRSWIEQLEQALAALPR